VPVLDRDDEQDRAANCRQPRNDARDTNAEASRKQ
jgi:hypothetical protein